MAADVMFDLERFRAPESLLSAMPHPPATRRRQKGWFLRGPIPGAWLQIAAGLPGHALHVGIALWHLVALKKTRHVVLSGKCLAKVATKPDAARRALRRLEKAGLVRVCRKPGCCPRVEILDAASVDPDAAD